MRCLLKGLYGLTVGLFAWFMANAQENNPYHLNGSAVQENCNCYTLTSDHMNQSGSLWNVNKIDLSESFDFYFDVFLGCHDSPGADGIVFVLQPISTSVGTTGEGLGYQGILPSIGVKIDTYQNGNHGDPSFDHISIQRNGSVDQGTAGTLAGPEPALPSGGNIEDCKFHKFRVRWDASAHSLVVGFDEIYRVSASIDLVKDVFGNDPMVFWGFTGATGGESNHQRVCTSLNPGFYLPFSQRTCFPEPISFIDSSHSFGSIVKWFWDFGDGTTDNVSSPPPHVYPAPGEYDVKLNILGNNGCISDTFTRKIIVGSEPVAGFTYSPGLVCAGAPINFKDASAVEFGSIDNWAWKLGPTPSAEKDPVKELTDPMNTVELTVKTKEGCESAPSVQQIAVMPRPTVDFKFTEVCVTEPAMFDGESKDPSVGIRQWYWDFGDGKKDSSVSTGHLFSTGGKYPVQLTAIAQNGCPSEPVAHDVNIYGTWAMAGNDTVVAENQPLQLNGSGGVFYKWMPNTGLSADNIPNPVATLRSDMAYVLTVSSPAGCPTSDTINIKVYKGPEFYVPSAFSPNNDGKNDRFRFFAVGMSSIDLFQVFNRYGQLIYSSTNPASGWDGMVNGIVQPASTYVWLIRGKDYLGNLHFKKGTVVLVK